jgi:hypothetical protein
MCSGCAAAAADGGGRMVVAVTSNTGIKLSSVSSFRRNVVIYRRCRCRIGGVGTIGILILAVLVVSIVVVVAASMCCTQRVIAVAVTTDKVTAGINPSFVRAFRCDGVTILVVAEVGNENEDDNVSISI